MMKDIVKLAKNGSCQVKREELVSKNEQEEVKAGAYEESPCILTEK